ncbi:nitrogen fixation master sensor histidine kinase, PAS domain-containing [Citrifermentans bemidjiense Bem]|uniref:histidine kinase n=1 Tax=Citrifermentans bemidjiense (strain ATCC BAA-1014 / DSM 16622 / JCM 12645 / Bem) TaxID=404380 RepID=B5EIA8_CITBB|nr:ATP-binding protein [Citrifermentans bemidjiense]ACH39810.1 nitrogen fixation master sensor histidine kinase, PAS domain-containing [Citrifermentans bemidjiense Bem]
MPEKLESYYANVIDSVGDGVIVLDNAGAVTLVNPAAEELAGVSRRQAMGVLFSEIFKGEGPLNEMVAKTVETGMSVSDHENIVVKRAGKLIPVGASTSPLLSAGGERIGTILLLRDLTNVRELESAVRQADRLSALGGLAAGLAHEIKNPLGGIKGAAQLLELEFPDNEDLREYIRVMLKEVQRVNVIVEELLALASPGRLKLSKVNLHRVLSDIVLLQKNASEGKEVYLQQYFDPSIPPILGDEALLTQLFLNLIKNALEAVEAGGVVKVTSRVLSDYAMTQKGERRARMVAIDIADNGPGIEAEVLENMFTPFFTTKSQGTGLGLAICQKIVSEHRGMIKVDSDAKRGTVFTVMLPLVQ